MPAVFTFFDNTSASLLPLAPAVDDDDAPCSRWSASTMTSIASPIGRRRSLAGLRYSASISSDVDQDMQSFNFPWKRAAIYDSLFYEDSCYGTMTPRSRASSLTSATATCTSGPSESSSCSHEPEEEAPLTAWFTSTSSMDFPRLNPLRAFPTSPMHKHQASSPFPASGGVWDTQALPRLDTPRSPQRASSEPSPRTVVRPMRGNDYFSVERADSSRKPARYSKSSQGSKRFLSSVKGFFVRRA